MPSSFRGRLKKIFAAAAAAFSLSGFLSACTLPAVKPQVLPEDLPPDYTQKYEMRHHVQKDLDANCVRFDAPDVKKEKAPALTSFIADMKKGGVVGRELADFSAREDFYLCACKLSDGILGKVFRNTGVVATASGKSKDITLRTAEHEMMHHKQFDNGIFMLFDGWDLTSWTASLLFMESAAYTSEVIFTFELNGGDEAKTLAAFAEEESMQERARHFIDNFHQARRNGLGHNQALEWAGSKTWQHVMTHQKFVDHYADTLLGMQIEDLVDGNLQDEGKRVISKMHALLSGYVNDDFNFTQHVRVPDGDRLFGKNREMAFAVEAVEIARARHFLGKDNPDVAARMKKAQAAGNPFLNTDITHVRKILGQPDNKLSALDAMKQAPQRPDGLDVTPGLLANDNSIMNFVREQRRNAVSCPRTARLF